MCHHGGRPASARSSTAGRVLAASGLIDVSLRSGGGARRRRIKMYHF